MPQHVAEDQAVKVLIERWRVHYNALRSHSALGYHPPAPEPIELRVVEANP